MPTMHHAITANSVANPKLLNDIWRSGAGFLNRLNPNAISRFKTGDISNAISAISNSKIAQIGA